jgi:hypothetical protein
LSREIVAAVPRQLSWTHKLIILGQSKRMSREVNLVFGLSNSSTLT